MDKHSSLFCGSITDEQKERFITKVIRTKIEWKIMPEGSTLGIGSNLKIGEADWTVLMIKNKLHAFLQRPSLLSLFM
jgi:hypothetical protein